MTSDYDYIVVGSGSAGAIVATRLSEDPEVRVALLEAGGSDRNILIRMPTALSMPMNMPRYNWGYVAEPDAGINGRVLECPRGKVLGGSSSINGMAFVRGHPLDFDAWHDLGAEGWTYRNCLPYFKKLERWHLGENRYRGGSGPVGVNAGNDMALNPLYAAFIEAGEQAGYPFTPDYNGYQQEGFGQKHMNVSGLERQSTARCYLNPARERPNLTIITAAMVDRIVFVGGVARAVVYYSAGRRFELVANAEIILSAGSVGSPMILQRSGIGPAKILEQAGVRTLFDVPGVGANLKDHLEVYFQYECTQPVSLNRQLAWWRKAIIGTNWLLRRPGLGSTNHFEACGFIRSRAGLPAPNIQYHFLPAAMRYDGRAAFAGDGYQVHVGPNKTRSQGQLSIRSADWRSPPKIGFNYLSHPQDLSDWRDTIRLTREVMMQDALAPFRGAEIQPGVDIESDGSIDAWVRQNVESAYHPSCSVKMGSDDDPLAVLDASCRLRCVDGLRVIDSSVFPDITNGNLNAPTMMVAERASDLLKGRHLPADDVPVWIASDWQSSQRSREGETRLL